VNDQNLIDEAMKARENAYVSFSAPVGAAVRVPGGMVFAGCNVEIPSSSLGFCAEQVAVLKAVSEGQQTLEKIVIVADERTLTYLPCGACRQLLAEFAPKLTVVLADLEGNLRAELQLSDLIPRLTSLKH